MHGVPSNVKKMIDIKLLLNSFLIIDNIGINVNQTCSHKNNCIVANLFVL